MKRLIAIILASALLLTLIPATVFSETTTETTTALTETEDEYIYYSDLFYGYSHYLTDSNFLSNHVKAQGAMNTAFNQYLDSPQFTWAAISKHISLTTNMSDLMLAYTDILGLTNVTYTNNLDEANKKFAEELFALKVGDIESISKDTKCIGQFKKILSTLQKVWKAIYDANDIKTYDTFVDLAYADLQTYCTNLKPLLPSLKSGTYTAMNELLSAADDTQEILDLFTALIISLGMEEVRLDTIQEIISTQENDTILYEGMNRLHSQLKNGFVGYFIGTYFEDKVIEEVAKHTSKFITKTIMEEVAEGIGASSAKAMTSVFGAVTASISLLNTIIFDWILGDQIPSIEDYQVTMILAQYSNLMQESVTAKQAVFQTQFDTEEIEKYETLMTAYAASMRCALDECAGLVEPINSSTEKNIKNIKTLFGDDFYTAYVDGVKSTIKTISPENRVITNYGTWKLTGNTTLSGGSDTIENGYIYCINHIFRGDISVYCDSKSGVAMGTTLTIPEGESFILDGNLDMYAGCLDNKGTLKVNNIGSKYEKITIKNAGEIITNDFKQSWLSSYSNGGWVTYGIYEATGKDAVLRVSGDYIGPNAGEDVPVIVFNGNSIQRISNLSAKNIIIENSSGVQYETDITLHGHYESNGNPINCNGFSTQIYNGVTFADGGNYGSIKLKENVSLSGEFAGDISVYCGSNAGVAMGTTLTIPEGESLILDGDLDIYFGCLDNYGTLKVNNIGNKYKVVSIRNAGTIIAGNFKLSWGSSNGVTYGKYETIGDSAILRVSGDYDGESTASIIPSIVFDGTSTQHISNLRAKNIIVENSAGIQYETDITLRGHYESNGNPINCNGFSTQIYNGATFADGGKYGSIKIRENVSLSGEFAGDISVYCGSNAGVAMGTTLTIPEGESLILDGNLDMYAGCLDNKGTLKVNNIGSKYDDITIKNAGEIITNDFKQSWLSSNGVLYGTYESTEEDAILKVSGDYIGSNAGEDIPVIIFNGTSIQHISNLSAKNIIVENSTAEGVVFTSAISPSVLFDHQGNNFTLYNNGTGSTFVDYDGDGLKDNVDPHPTIHEDSMNILRTSIINNTTNESLDYNNDGVVDICDLVYLSLKFAS